MSYDSKNFWKIKEYTDALKIANIYERLDENIKNLDIFNKIVNPKQRLIDNLEYANILTGQQIVRNQVVTADNIKNSDMESAVTGVYAQEDVTDEVNEMLNMLSQESQYKILQMFFDSYMAPRNSDINWRLGPVTGVVLNTDFNDNQLGMITDGKMYTRSNFTIPYYRKFLANGLITDKEERFTSLFFPPFKIGEFTEINQKTAFMKSVLATNPDPTWDQDTFMIKRSGYTYRDPGYKSISDYISFLQWVIEGCTGIVSTYLTEWDLSLYMQEGLMTPNINGGSSPIYLNYRIKKDNPIATEDGKYTDDRAYCYNVTGSAVSKFENVNQKHWRPSDYPLSQWWMPYTRGVHWDMKNMYVEDLNLNICYMDIYDNISSTFEYESASLRDLFRHQDYIGYVLGTWPNEKLNYYRAFYRTDGDFLTDFDVTENSWTKKVAGAAPGKSATIGKSMNDFLKKARHEMIINGGYYGGPKQPGDVGGYMQRAALANLEKEEDRTNTANSALEDSGFDQISNGDYNAMTESSVMTDAMNQTVDASNMCSYKGVNRFSPAIFGGPHGSDYSPNTIQGYFDENSIIMKNIARVSDYNSREYRSQDEMDYYTDLNKFYSDNERLNGCSPNKSISKLVKGDFGYYWDYGYVSQTISEMIGGEIDWDYKTKSWSIYTFPEKTKDQRKITYIGDNISFKMETKVYVKDLPWTKDNWWYEWDAYYNPANVSTTTLYWFFNIYTVTSKVPYRLGSYQKVGFQSFKNTFFDDEPNLKWQIVHHDFPNDRHVAHNEVRLSNRASKFWTKLTPLMAKFGFVKEANNVRNEHKEGRFVLKFYGDANTEKRILNNLIQRLKGNQKASLVFLEGNVEHRYKTGPASMFRAPVDVDYYTNAIVTKLKIKILWFTITINLPPSFVNVPFINVHLYDTVWFEDNLQAAPKSNRSYSGSDYPLHLKNPITDSTIQYKDNPIQKFSECCNDVIVSSRTDVTVNGNVWDVITGGLDELGSMGTDVNWISKGRMGLTGIGILSSIQGIEPDVGDIGIFEEKIVQSKNGIIERVYHKAGEYNYGDFSRLPSSAKTMALSKIPYKFHKMTDFESKKVSSFSLNKQYWTEGPMPKYRQIEADDGFKYAMGKIFTRAKFYPENLNGEQPAAYITIDTPIRNFLSVCLTQISFLQFARDAILENTSFEVLNKSLRECVDKCVVKASGMDYTGKIIEPDRHHVLYSYWIEQAINLFGTKESFVKYKEQIRSEVNRKITKFEYVIDELSKTCAIPVMEWTMEDYNNCINLIASMKEETRVSIFDRFLFAYLHILYNYRFYFIARRFNKESGTMWIMRALESILDLIKNEANPPPSPRKLMNTAPNYRVSFYELNNPSSMKHEAILSGGDIQLAEDRVTTLYVKINWADESQYEEYQKYLADPAKEIEKPEVVIVYKNGVKKYAFKPTNGLYKFMSDEIIQNDKNKNWNKLHPKETQRLEQDYDECIFNITWGDSPDMTPIKWDVFGNVNVNNLLEYGKHSISPDELLCLIEQGADFWTVSIPAANWPRSEGYKTKLFLKAYVEEQEVTKEDAYVTLLGPLAYQVYPIVINQERPEPSICLSNPNTWKDMLSGTTGAHS
jgi:hypothetical protein